MADVAPQPATPPPPPGPPGKLTLIGAGHVFQIEDAIRQAILALQPDVVFVELDRGRLNGLIEKRRGNAAQPKGGFVHKRLAKVQESVAGMYGADVGGEMLGAVGAAQQLGARVSFIDDAAEDTLRRALSQLTWREKFRAVGMLIGGAAKSAIPRNRRNAKADIEAEIKRYQDDPESVLGPEGELARKFPTIHRIVIRERDEKMAKRIRTQLAGIRHGVAVIGDGHLNGMIPMLADLKPTVFRLADVRDGRLPRALPFATGTTEKIGFSLQIRT
ncbi:MAG: TraB/GumN family protein [bacterium]